MYSTVEIMGGLGNQLFQIFALISYSLKSNTQFYFENKPITCGERKKYYWNTLLLERLKGFIKSININPIMYKEPNFHYNTIPIISHRLYEQKIIKLFGYFQSEKYFIEHKNTIFRLIKLNESQQKIRNKVLHLMPTTFDNIVSIHFRVGDYAHQQQNHPLMPVQYYEKALEKLLDDTHDKKDWFILYFCEENDINYVNEKINYLKKNTKLVDLTFIKVPEILDDWEQMLTMSLCQHHIIANSTFSWWGAYFGSDLVNNNKLVYYPSIWFGRGLGDKKMDDLFPEGWKKINIYVN